jgi:hypothetical protein
MPDPSGPLTPKVRIAIVLVIAILVVVAGYWWYQTHEKTRTLKDGTRVVTAPEGDLVSQFPKEMILEGDARTTESYRIEYSAVSQPAATYVSAKSLADNVAAFGKYLADEHWDIVTAADPAATRPTFFYATRPSGEAVNVSFAAQTDGHIQVVIAYAAPKAK